MLNDDEQPTQTEVLVGLDGKVEAKAIHKQEAAKGEKEFKVLLELKGIGSKDGRLGVDLVTVLDISGSMRLENRIIKMKLAMQFLVKKLGHTDRLSVVTFNRKADRLCPLRWITEESRIDIVDQVNALASRSSTNTESGLRLAIQILENRRYSHRRRAAIMLMTDGMEDEGTSHAVGVSVRDVPVYTFALGRDCDTKMLSDIAKNSNGGMFAAVSDSDNLNVAFSTALAGLLHVAIDELTLTIAPLNSSQLNEVNAGNYPQTKQGTSLTVTFRSLYDRETRRVLVVVTLPDPKDVEGQLDILDITYKYRVGAEDTLKSDENTIGVTLVKGMSTEAENEEVLAEERRVKTVSKMKEARVLADAKELEKARGKLVDAKAILLSEVDATLTAQLDQLFLYMVSEETYYEEGYGFALALEASHEVQRATTLPASVPGMFNTPLTDIFIEQARSFENDPEDYQVPTEEEDNKIVALVH